MAAMTATAKGGGRRRRRRRGSINVTVVQNVNPMPCVGSRRWFYNLDWTVLGPTHADLAQDAGVLTRRLTVVTLRHQKRLTTTHYMLTTRLFDMYHANNVASTSLGPHKAQGPQLASFEALAGSAAKNTSSASGNGKQRLRWTSDLHDRFVDAITQLGGPDSELMSISILQ
ncbi:hypothetical protein CRG98_044653 [Punica granatum]|uniref:Uncharacterized protein n=1 Tax=Punica granatum TaxID=22663 RepID=A0A2I0HTA8_PUNGR|nr:hypothetical protein CRG98_044653 [Punica granatum]